MSLLSYKLIHVFGFLLLFSALGALIAEAAGGHRRLLSALHGVALLLLVVSGFGMLARLGGGFPGWVMVKIVIWLALAAAAVLVRRQPSPRPLWWIGLPLLGAVAGYLASFKPF